jgi:hypothetical protein
MTNPLICGATISPVPPHRTSARLLEPWSAPFALINGAAVGLVPILLPIDAARYGVGPPLWPAPQPDGVQRRRGQRRAVVIGDRREPSLPPVGHGRLDLPRLSRCSTLPEISQVTVCSPMCGCGGTRITATPSTDIGP